MTDLLGDGGVDLAVCSMRRTTRSDPWRGSEIFSSNRRNAAATAASRAISDAGGGSGRPAGRSCSVAIAGPYRQPAPHLMHAPGHRRLRDAERRGGFGVAHILADHQHDSLAQRPVKPGDGAGEPETAMKIAAIGRARQAGEGGEMPAQAGERGGPPMVIA